MIIQPVIVGGGKEAVKTASGSKGVTSTSRYAAPITVSGLAFKPKAVVMTCYMSYSGSTRVYAILANETGGTYVLKEEGGGVGGTSTISLTDDGFAGTLTVYNEYSGSSFTVNWWAIG